MSIRSKQRISGHLKYCIGFFAVPILVIAFQNSPETIKRSPSSTKPKMTHSQAKPMTSFQLSLSSSDEVLVGDQVEFTIKLQSSAQMDSEDIQIKWILPNNYSLVRGTEEESLGTKAKNEIFESSIRVRGKASPYDKVVAEVSNILDNGAKLGSIASIKPLDVYAMLMNRSSETTEILKSSIEEPSSIESEDREKTSKEKKIFY